MLPDHDDNTPTNPETKEPDFAAPPLKPFTRRGSHAPSKPPAAPGSSALKSPTFQADSKHPQIPGVVSAPRSGLQTRNQADARRLIVGGGIKLTGEISDCESLIIEGEVDVTLTGGQLIEVLPNGVFRGDVDVVEAYISGSFDGKLTVRDHLVVRSGGRVSGKVRYGRVTIESGGEVVGDMGTLDAESDSAGEKT